MNDMVNVYNEEAMRAYWQTAAVAGYWIMCMKFIESGHSELPHVFFHEDDRATTFLWI